MEDVARQRASVATFEEEFQRQRRFRAEADSQYNEAKHQLSFLLQSSSRTASFAKLAAERARLEGLRTQLARDLELRRRREVEIQDSIKEYDGLRPELQG